MNEITQKDKDQVELLLKATKTAMGRRRYRVMRTLFPGILLTGFSLLTKAFLEITSREPTTGMEWEDHVDRCLIRLSRDYKRAFMNYTTDRVRAVNRLAMKRAKAQREREAAC